MTLILAEKLSAFKFYQYFLSSVSDTEVIKFLRMLTFLPMEDIAAIERHMEEASYRPNTAQRKLAEEVTRFVHGEEGLAQALAATKVSGNGAGMRIPYSRARTGTVLQASKALSNIM